MCYLGSCFLLCVHVCVCKVGIVLHYSSLSTLLWIGISARVLYKEALWRSPRQPEGEATVVPTQRPMLRSVMSSGWYENIYLSHVNVNPLCCSQLHYSNAVRIYILYFTRSSFDRNWCFVHCSCLTLGSCEHICTLILSTYTVDVLATKFNHCFAFPYCGFVFSST